MGTEDLIGAKLDASVARAQGWEQISPDSAWYERLLWKASHDYSPSTDWSQGGPIIECELIDVSWTGHPTKPTWTAKIYPEQGQGEGPTPLIAAMRAFVASKK
jgi:hypothetical protein